MKIFKRNKYHNKPCFYKGIKFQSQIEMERYIFLESKQDSGEISDLQTQVRIELLPKITETVQVQMKTKVKEKQVSVQQPIYYIPDFVYKRGEETVYEDVKSAATVTKVYALKKKMLRALKNITVVEVYDPTEWIQSKPRR